MNKIAIASMKLFSKYVISALLMFSNFAVAQGCNSIDRNKLANRMGIDKTLIPYLSLEIPSCANINLVDDYAGFVLNEVNERIHNGIRSEIAINYPFVEGDTVEYRWSILVPKASAPGGGEKEWWVIAQWHDQPDPRLGETWAKFKAQSPPVAIYIENRNGVVGIGIQGMLGKKISWSPVTTDVWLDLSAVIHWSTGDTGSVRLGVDGYPNFNHSLLGPNMLNSYQHYFKAGQYRAPTVEKYSVINIKNVRFKKL